MTVPFRRPDNTPNWRKVVESFIPAAPSALSLAALATTPAAPLAFAAGAATFYANVHKAIRDAAEAARPEHTTDERAWVWLRVSLTVATFAFLNERELRSPLDTNEKKAVARDFLADALALGGEGTLDLAMLINPAACPLLAPVMDRLPRLAREVAPEHRLSDERIRADFARILRATSSRVYELETQYYRPVADSVTGHFSEGARRDFAWARHENWVRGHFHREPIFSPDADETIPLSRVYHRLRCFWHTEDAPPRDARHADPEAERNRTAHIADLHDTLNAWLRAPGTANTIRVVAGGPGSGKSSFSRAFAAEVIAAGDHRVVYVPLQYLRLGGTLRERIGPFLRERWHATAQDGGAGFEENPLAWRAWESLPYLLVFDGLDELSHEDDTARDLSRKFILSVHSMLAAMGAGPPVRGLILGRSAACQDALKEASLDLDALIHVAPLTPLVRERKPENMLGKVAALSDPGDLGRRDERPEFWRRSAEARGLPADPVPEAVTARALDELNAEPLLLHLLIVSGYTGANWQAAAGNPNLIYRSIFTRIFERNEDKKRLPGAKRKPPDPRELADFFTLQECLGLAAWRSNGRTGSSEDFDKLRDLHATAPQRERFVPAFADLRSVAIQVHTRRDIADKGFEFIHKSFGEYLAARGLLAAGRRFARLMTEGEEPWTNEMIALRWVKLIASAELTEELLRFLANEARLLRPDDATAALPPLTQVFNASLAHGMPVHKVAPDATFRALETMQRCAESALLAVLDALIRCVRSKDRGQGSGPRRVIEVQWGLDPLGPLHFLHRIRATSGSPSQFVLGGLDLSNASLHMANLFEADLSGAHLSAAMLSGATLSGAYLSGAYLFDANLSYADLFEADLFEADLSGANLNGADLSGATLFKANLHGADLSGADLQSADLRGARNLDPASLGSAFGVRAGVGRTLLPDGVAPPDHWHVGTDVPEDSPEARDAYRAAYYAWRAARSGEA